MHTDRHDYNRSLISFLDSSPTAFHATRSMLKLFTEAGMTRLHEHERWDLKEGQSYVVCRENSAIIAFTLGSKEQLTDGFRMVAAHSDSPGLMIKPQAAITSQPYLQLGVEVYGGPLLTTWFDRDLSLAGRIVCVDNSRNLREFLIDFKRPLLTIPSLAIHLDREANNGKAVDKQKALPPILAQTLTEQLPDFQAILRTRLREEHDETIGEGDILSFDLFCYDSQPAAFNGLNQEFIVSGRLDNLLSCHLGTSAICHSDTSKNRLFISSNHEENGSTSTTGANGSFLEDILRRIIPDDEEQAIAFRNSYLISADNAHAVHPNFKDKSDPNHQVTLNGGPVIKVNANQRYSTNSRTSAKFKLMARDADVPCQEFVMRSDMACGSTVGPMTAARLGIETIDIGAPTFSMHSIREITGSMDPYYLYTVISRFFNKDKAEIRD